MEAGEHLSGLLDAISTSSSDYWSKVIDALGIIIQLLGPGFALGAAGGRHGQHVSRAISSTGGLLPVAHNMQRILATQAGTVNSLSVAVARLDATLDRVINTIDGNSEAVRELMRNLPTSAQLSTLSQTTHADVVGVDNAIRSLQTSVEAIRTLLSSPKQKYDG